jgi:3-phosphoshikimate 1-carboxyvinyltransferase
MGGRVSRVRAIVRGSSVAGEVRAPPSKSYTQRALACALLAGGTSEILNPSASEDGLSALRAAEALGARVSRSEGGWRVSGGSVETPSDVVGCGGSATALRFFTALSAHAPGASVLTGDASLKRRPMKGLLVAMNSLGAKCLSTRGNGMPPVVVMGGGIDGGEAAVEGSVSSQYVSALIMSCTKARGATTIAIEGELESKHYVDMTMEVVERFGGACRAGPEGRVFRIPPQQQLMPCRFLVEGDHSSAAFMLAAGALAGDVRVRGVGVPSRQGDSQVVSILKVMGGDVSISDTGVRSSRSRLKGMELDARHVPDLVPVMAALASRASGDTVIKGVKRLRYKESDRIAALLDAMGRMGGAIRAEEDAIVVSGNRATKGAQIDPHGDHRIAMACSVLALASEGTTTINDAGCVSKSYPSFFDDLRSIGGDVEVVP